MARRPCARLAGSGRDALASDFPGPQGTTLAFVEEPPLHAGLKIAADGNVVDGTQAGLLADRARSARDCWRSSKRAMRGTT
jgi:hypothetical protein